MSRYERIKNKLFHIVPCSLEEKMLQAVKASSQKTCSAHKKKNQKTVTMTATLLQISQKWAKAFPFSCWLFPSSQLICCWL